MLLSSIICDRVIFDRFTGMPTLVNILQNLNAQKFPVRTHQLVFFCELTNGHDKSNVKVRLVDVARDDKIIFEKNGTVQFRDVKQVVTMAMALQGVVFDHPGEYRFQLLVDEQLLGERMVVCRQISIQPKPPEQNQNPH